MAKKILKAYEALYPVPVVLVTCTDLNGTPNIITIAWAGVVCSSPAAVSISIRPSRYSHGLIKQAGEFAVNIPNERHLFETDYCGTVSGRDVDKFKQTGFSAVSASSIKAPLIKECPVNLECRVKDIIKLGAHDMFIADVLAVNVDQDALNASGSFDHSRVSPIVYNQGQYWSLNKKIGDYGFSKSAK